MRKDTAEFVAVLASEMNGFSAQVIADAANKLCRLSRQHGRLQEDDCNRGLTDAERALEARIEASINATLAELSLPAAKFSSDPRGYTVKIALPSGRSNSFGGDGWGIPQ